VLGLIKVLYLTTEFSIKRPVKTCCVESKCQIKGLIQDSRQFKISAVLTNMTTQLVTVIALNGQRDKHSETFWISPQMKLCGIIALLKLGK